MRALFGLITGAVVLCVCIYAAYHSALYEAFSGARRQIVPTRLFYITVADRASPGLTAMQQAVEAQGEILNVIGLYEQRGTTTQLQAIHDLVNSPVCNSNDIVLYTNAHDVLYCGDKETILQRYAALSSPVVIGATKVDPGTYDVSADDALTPFPYLDDGFVIGRVWALRECLKDWAFDGANWITQYLTRPDVIALDHEASLFLNTDGVDKKDIQCEGSKVSFRCSTMPQFVKIIGSYDKACTSRRVISQSG